MTMKDRDQRIAELENQINIAQTVSERFELWKAIKALQRQ